MLDVRDPSADELVTLWLEVDHDWRDIRMTGKPRLNRMLSRAKSVGQTLESPDPLDWDQILWAEKG